MPLPSLIGLTEEVRTSRNRGWSASQSDEGEESSAMDVLAPETVMDAGRNAELQDEFEFRS